MTVASPAPPLAASTPDALRGTLRSLLRESWLVDFVGETRRLRLVGLVEVLLPDEVRDARLMLPNLLPPKREDEMADIYRDLRHSAERDESERYQELLKRLRELQAVEARDIENEARRNWPLPSETVEAALRRADELLSRHGGPSA